MTTIARRSRATDDHALQLIAEGRIVCDPNTGVVLVDGVPKGHNINGYQRVRAAGRSLSSHRVVWLYTVGPIPDGHVINHRDGNKRNNRISNLEVVTHRQNVLHGLKHNDYRGTYPDDVVDADLATAAAQLAASDATRADVLELMGVTPEPENHSTEALMRTRPGRL